MPLIRYREPRRGDIVVFRKPVYQPGIDAAGADGTPHYTTLVKRLIGLPGDHIHLRNGIVIVNGVVQSQPYAQPTTPENFNEFLDGFPSVPPSDIQETTESWDLAFPKYIQNGDTRSWCASFVSPANVQFAPGKHSLGARCRSGGSLGRHSPWSAWVPIRFETASQVHWMLPGRRAKPMR